MSSKARYEEHRGSPYLVQAAPGFLESIPDEETPESLYEKHESILKSELARMLAKLPVTEAEAITKWLHGMTQAEIAAQDGVTQAAVSIRAKRGLEKLFALRDAGELGTLKFIWDGLHKIKGRIDAEIAMERAADSDVSLPLGEELGEELGEKLVLLDPPEIERDGSCVPIAFHPTALNGAKKRSPVKKARLDTDRTAQPLTRLVCEVEIPSVSVSHVQIVRHEPANIHVDNETGKRTRLKRAASDLNVKERCILAAIRTTDSPVHINGLEIAANLTNLEVRNSLRRLVKNQLVSKLGKGRYTRCPL